MLSPRNIKALLGWVFSFCPTTTATSESDTTMDKDQESTGPLVKRIPFPAADASYRAARLRSAIACREYNNQPEDATAEQRAKLWNA
jgi:hypothetical protein